MDIGLLTRRQVFSGSASLLAMSACSGFESPRATSLATQDDLDGLPYHPVPMHLDLCILSYQLYAQTLVWPFDPYYEQHGSDGARDAFMDQVRSQLAGFGSAGTSPATAGFRGPGVLAGFPNNQRHDPIIYRYDTLKPWQASLNLGYLKWTDLQPQDRITHNISDVSMCYRPSRSTEEAIQISHVARSTSANARGARDQLIAFEGETGDKNEPGQPGSQSMMGYVLKRQIAGSADYDVYVVFRGSRSGEPVRAARQALSGTGAKGNPDWITDLGYDFVQAPDISQVGTLHRGLVRSVQSMLPKIIGALSEIADGAQGRKPRRISMTGHSLGGGLALQTASAILLGNALGPDGIGAMMPASLQTWPWANMKLVTFGAPVSGDAAWAKALTEDKLQSQFFETAAWGTTLTDADALPVSDPQLVTRLTDTGHPVAYRILNPQDPITTLRLLGGKHVGQTVYVAPSNPLSFVDPNTHEPANIRDLITEALGDPDVPASGWQYHPVTALSPDSMPGHDGDPAEYTKLFTAIDGFYRVNSTAFGHRRFKRDFDLFMSILNDAA
jgi:hypothetical protein